MMALNQMRQEAAVRREFGPTRAIGGLFAAAS